MIKTSVITNIAAYQFARLDDLPGLRQRLLAICKAGGLKGTILLSVEGINLFVAGEREALDQLVAEIRSIPGLEKLSPKVSESDDQPFSRMLVRIKKEIISFGVDGIDPATRTSPKLSARELKSWLDEGRPVTLLDTRNDYEVKLGTFRGAHVLNIDHFREFPEAVGQLPATMKETPIVMFCTGGIRCEKAGPYMEREGFQNIFQLDGGILKYFEEVGGEHYDGECFVFDHRVGLDPGLRETDSALCFACQTPLQAKEQNDPRFVANVSCPYCYKNSEEQMTAQIALRHEAIRRICTPLPGSISYDHRRPFQVPPTCDGSTLIDTLSTIFPKTSREEWLLLCEQNRVQSESGQSVSASQEVRSGERYDRLTPATIEPEVNPDIRILYEDEAFIVLEKPASLPTHRGETFNRNTLQFILNEVYAPQKIQIVNHLPANSRGLIVCARTRHFFKLVEPQFLHDETKASPTVLTFHHPLTQQTLTFCVTFRMNNAIV